MHREPATDPAAPLRDDSPAPPAEGNPNERVEQWESEYFETPADEGVAIQARTADLARR